MALRHLSVVRPLSRTGSPLQPWVAVGDVRRRRHAGDTNYHHAVAWFRAFRRYDVTVQVWRIHRAIGMWETGWSRQWPATRSSRSTELLDFESIGERWISGDDASKTKPDPDLLEVALDGCGDGRAVLIGADELVSAGADRLYDSLTELQDHLKELPLAEVKLDR